MTEKWRFGTNGSLLAEKCAPNSHLKRGETSDKTQFSMARSRELSRWAHDWAIFLGFCVRKVGAVLSLWWGKGQMASERNEGWTASGEKSTGFSGKKRSFREKWWVFLSYLRSLSAPLLPVGAEWTEVQKKLPAFRRMGECAQVVALRFFVKGYALASGAPKGVAVRPTPSVAAG